VWRASSDVEKGGSGGGGTALTPSAPRARFVDEDEEDEEEENGALAAAAGASARCFGICVGGGSACGSCSACGASGGVAARAQSANLRLARCPGAAALAHAELERVEGLGAAAARDHALQVAAALDGSAVRGLVREALAGR
jgi:hypothetical protein